MDDILIACTMHICTYGKSRTFRESRNDDAHVVKVAAMASLVPWKRECHIVCYFAIREFSTTVWGYTHGIYSYTYICIYVILEYGLNLHLEHISYITAHFFLLLERWFYLLCAVVTACVSVCASTENWQNICMHTHLLQWNLANICIHHCKYM